MFRKIFKSKHLSLNQKIYRETFWRPKFNFEKMILDCISYYRILLKMIKTRLNYITS